MKLKRTLSTVMASVMLACTAMMPQGVSAAEHYIVKEPIFYGDVDQNDAVDVGDAVLLARFLAEDASSTITEYGKQCADVNQSGQLDPGDIVMILEFIALLRPTLAPRSAHIYQSVNLMDGVTANKVKGKAADEAFLSSQYRLTANLLKEAAADADGGNLMISPLSISQALAMTANGAYGDTLKEMESVLGDQIGINDLNAYYYNYTSNLSDEENASLKRANAIWVMNDADRINVPTEFLQTNANYYGADIFKANFDDSTLDEVNDYVNEHTNGMIPKMLDNFAENTVMLLLNAIAFEAKWQKTYPEWATADDDFTLANGEKISVPMMHGDEYFYICDDNATGFFKMYEGGNYSFAAILPNEDISLSDYIAGLDAEAFLNLVGSRKVTDVQVAVPKFSFSYDLTLNDALTNMGMSNAFDDLLADFRKLDTYNNVYITRVLHKTFIELDENGTKAAAATTVEMGGKGMPQDQKEVILNRPFLFMIVDEHTSLPIFIGTVTNPSAAAE